MNLIRTEQIQIKGTDELSSLCHLSKNLWNEANYLIRQEFFINGNWIRYNTLAATLKTSENYKNLNAQTAQQILRVLDRSWNSFFKAIKEWSKNPDKFIGRPKLPNYKPKDGEAYAKIHNRNRVIGIDLGLRNVVTIANNIGEIPIVIKGGILKSMNQYYNKEKAQLQSIYDKQGIKFGTS